MKPKAKTIPWIAAKTKTKLPHNQHFPLRQARINTHNRLYPSFTIQRSNRSRMFNSRGRSPLISPDINILVKGGHLDLSDTFIEPVLDLLNPFSMVRCCVRPQVDFLKGCCASMSKIPRCPAPAPPNYVRVVGR
jgi:hypothetical protein